MVMLQNTAYKAALFIFQIPFTLIEQYVNIYYLFSNFKSTQGPSKRAYLFSKAGNAPSVPLALWISMDVDEHHGVPDVCLYLSLLKNHICNPEE